MNRYAVIDVETTGLSAHSSKIIEVAVILIDGDKIVETYSSLIDPEIKIPKNITKLTGISEQMLIGAPKFYEVAKKLIQLLEGRTFVAHNVSFDYSFFKKEFADLGFEFKADKLCTVQLSRKSFPGLATYSLGPLCKSLDIKLESAHRALADAMAAAQILLKAQKKA